MKQELWETFLVLTTPTVEALAVPFRVEFQREVFSGRYQALVYKQEFYRLRQAADDQTPVQETVPIWVRDELNFETFDNRNIEEMIEKLAESLRYLGAEYFDHPQVQDLIRSKAERS